MNLQQTVSRILGREVSIEEAKNFANDQYGVLCQFNREWEQKVAPEKEVRIYLCDTTDFEEETGLNIQGYLETDSWTGKEEKVQKFIEHAENTGRVYSLKGFQEAVNQQYEDNLTNSFIFIGEINV
jgi:hypothetical protein